MAKPKQLERLKQGVEGWNKWRTEHPDEHIDLSRAKLSKADLSWADLSRANLSEANLSKADLTEAVLSKADLTNADLRRAVFFRANLMEANLSMAMGFKASFGWANLSRANLSAAFLINADLQEADLTNADLRGADLTFSNLAEAHLDNGDLRGCRVYGVSAWDVQLAGAKQTDLVITPGGTAQITADDLEVAQFIHLLLTNRKTIRLQFSFVQPVAGGKTMEKQKTYAGKWVMNVIRRYTMPILATLVFVSGAQAQTTRDLLGSLSANNGLYGNRIPSFSPPSAYTEVCFKGGSVLNDQHPSGGSTMGGNCLPGDTGWIIERDERGQASWTMARADCLLDRMRLPEPFEFQYSCENALTFGLNNMTVNAEWATNFAVVMSVNDGVAAIRLGNGGNCTDGGIDWVARPGGTNGLENFQCVK